MFEMIIDLLVASNNIRSDDVLKLLNVSKRLVKVKIVCEEKRGLFGMEGAKLAKVKLSLLMEKTCD